jgi:hypothetical protein
MTQDKVRYSVPLLLFMFLQLVIASGNVRHFNTDTAQLSNMFLIVGVSLVYNRFRLSIRVIPILAAFLAIAIPTIVLHGMDVRLYFGYAIRIVSAFFLVQIYKDTFWEYFLKVTQVLVAISLPMYVIQLVMPRILRVLQPITDALMINITGSHQYAVVWRYNQWNVEASTRNSGFMWEPSAFAAVMVWVLLAKLIKDNFVFDKWTYIIILAFVTTFSTGGYIGLSLLLLASMLHTKAGKMKYLGMAVVILGLLVWDSYSGIVSKNYESSVRKIEMEETHIYNATSGLAEAGNISRVAAYARGFQVISESPFGYGLPTNTDEYGVLGYSPNAFMNHFIRWGILGISIILISMWMTVRYLLYQSKVSVSPVVFLLLFGALMMSFHGTTLDKQIVSLAVMLFYWFRNPKIGKTREMKEITTGNGRIAEGKNLLRA